MKNNDTWIKEARNRERWRAMESEYAKTAAAISVDSVLRRESSSERVSSLCQNTEDCVGLGGCYETDTSFLMECMIGSSQVRDLQYRKSRVFEDVAVHTAAVRGFGF